MSRFLIPSILFTLCSHPVWGGSPCTHGIKGWTPCSQEAPLSEEERCPPALCPARITLSERPEHWPCNTYLEGSFLYWYASQDGMSLATSGSLQSSTVVNLENGADLLTQPFSYDPGFQIALGFGYGVWEFEAKYTWIRQKTSLQSNAPTANAAGGTGVWSMNNWFVQAIGSNNSPIVATSLTSDWKLALDLLDVSARCPSYRTTHWVVSPYGGLRAGWIRQSLEIQASVPSGALTIGQKPLSPQPIYSHNRSHSWGVGPMVGTGISYPFGSSGLRGEGRGDFALLFTQYTSISHGEDAASSTSSPSSFSLKQTHYNTLRPMIDLSCGFGWGRHLCRNRYHLDLSADYSFTVLWNQNMIRTLVDEWGSGASSSNDLFLQGLTLTGRFDF